MEVEATLTIVGEGELKEQLQQRVLDDKLADKVRIMGRASDEALKRCMEIADVFVLPSVERSEAFGLVQLEAMAYGIPVINTKLSSGVPEVSIHGKTGLTVTPGNVEELKKAMMWMAEHDDERMQMGKAARKRLEENFTMEMMLTKLKEIYRELSLIKI